jgi:phytoene dehydrogenase-like protein
MRPIIIGAGHNGLAAAFYLAKAGLRPLVLEARDIVGGAAATHEIRPGFRVPSAAHAAGPLHPAVEADMELAALGLEFICPAVASFAPTADGRAVLIARDGWNSARYLAPISEHDASRVPEFQATVSRIGRALAEVSSEPPPSIDGGAMELLRVLRAARPIRALARKDAYRLARWLPMPVADLVDEWFEHETVRAVVATHGLAGANAGPRSGGTAAALLLDAARHPAAPGAPCFVRGGPGALAAAMARAATAAGAEIRLASPVSRIEFSGGGRTVVLADGTAIPASVVLSNADPVRTLLGLIDPERLGPETAARVQHYRIAGTLAKVNVALDALPSFAAAATLPAGLSAAEALSGRILIAPDVDYLERAFDASKYGAFSERPWLECTIPTLTDPGLAPAGKHVMSIYARYAPYALRAGDWTVMRASFQQAVVDVLETYAPGVSSRVLEAELLTPPDLEARFGLTGGHPHHGEMALDQLYFMRPLPGWAGYRTPIPGLYLCGAGTHPGGGLTGASGAAAARVVLRDLRRRQVAPG